MAQTSWAAEGDESIDDVVAGGEASSERIMLRQVHTVQGYQELEVAGQKFDASYMEETLGERYGAIVLLHDLGDQFDSAGVINSLRHNLPEHGWSTLTLSLDYPFKANVFLIEKEDIPVEESMTPDEEQQASSSDDTLAAEPAADPAQAEVESTQAEPEQEGEDTAVTPISNSQRVDAALSFLQEKDVKRIVVIGHGKGGSLAIELLETITTPISGLVLVGEPSLVEEQSFKELVFPMLDAYGERDLDGVSVAVKTRKVIMKRVANKLYQARRVSGADHQFSGLQPTLTATINGWLRKQFVEEGDN